MKSKFLIFSVIAGMAFTGCSSVQATYASFSDDGKYYLSVESDYNHPKDFLLKDLPEQNINGENPEHIYVKTLTQTFTRDYEFIIKDRKLWFKKKTESEWKLYKKTGLPKGSDAVCEIFADSNCIFVFDEKNRLFRTYTEKEAGTKPFRWVKEFGWPKSDVLQQGKLVNDKRGWAMGARRKDMLWYEDIFGNEHHYGTMGLETMYFLTKDGNRIRFTDSGLPPDFSNSILTPESGSFIASNISNSASTIFIIGDKGTMYTRLIDFDTMGCDPMFFKYTYEPYKSEYKGSEYLSNYEPWGLPAEDWYQQPAIKLEGKARLSRYISIHQDGQGNSARELRVAGLNAQGKTGFYSKEIFDKEWNFIETPLTIAEKDFLSGGSEWGKSELYSFAGNLFVEKFNSPEASVPEISCSTENFSLASEGKFNLKITMKGKDWTETKIIPMHSVEMWTYMVRIDPGKDGVSKSFFITPDFEENALSAQHEEFTLLLKQMFEGLNRKTFAIEAESTVDFLELKWANKFDSRLSKNFHIFMDKNGNGSDPSNSKTYYAYENSLARYFDESGLNLEKEIYTQEDTDELMSAIENNKKYKSLLDGQQKVFNGYKHNSNQFRIVYNTADLILGITLLKHVDFPKFKTVTSHGKDLVKQNAANYESSFEKMKFVYPHVAGFVDLRIEKYNEILKDLEDNPSVKNKKEYKFSAAEYFEALGIAKVVEGYSKATEKKAYLMQIEDIPLFPGFLMTVYDKEKSEYIMVELPEFPEDAKKALKKGDDKFETKAKFYVASDGTSKKSSTAQIEKLNGKSGKIVFDGKDIVVKTGFMSGKTLFTTKTEEN